MATMYLDPLTGVESASSQSGITIPISSGTGVTTTSGTQQIGSGTSAGTSKLPNYTTPSSTPQIPSAGPAGTTQVGSGSSAGTTKLTGGASSSSVDGTSSSIAATVPSYVDPVTGVETYGGGGSMVASSTPNPTVISLSPVLSLSSSGNGLSLISNNTPWTSISIPVAPSATTITNEDGSTTTTTYTIDWASYASNLTGGAAKVWAEAKKEGFTDEQAYQLVQSWANDTNTAVSNSNAKITYNNTVQQAAQQVALDKIAAGGYATSGFNGRSGGLQIDPDQVGQVVSGYNIAGYLAAATNPAEAMATLKDAGFTTAQIQAAAKANLAAADMANSSQISKDKEYSNLWTALTPWHESKGETFGSAFIKPFTTEASAIRGGDLTTLLPFDKRNVIGATFNALTGPAFSWVNQHVYTPIGASMGESSRTGNGFTIANIFGPIGAIVQGEFKYQPGAQGGKDWSAWNDPTWTINTPFGHVGTVGSKEVFNNIVPVGIAVASLAIAGSDILAARAANAAKAPAYVGDVVETGANKFSTAASSTKFYGEGSGEIVPNTGRLGPDLGKPSIATPVRVVGGEGAAYDIANPLGVGAPAYDTVLFPSGPGLVPNGGVVSASGFDITLAKTPWSWSEQPPVWTPQFPSPGLGGGGGSSFNPFNTATWGGGAAVGSGSSPQGITSSPAVAESYGTTNAVATPGVNPSSASVTGMGTIDIAAYATAPAVITSYASTSSGVGASPGVTPNPVAPPEVPGTEPEWSPLPTVTGVDPYTVYPTEPGGPGLGVYTPPGTYTPPPSIFTPPSVYTPPGTYTPPPIIFTPPSVYTSPVVIPYPGSGTDTSTKPYTDTKPGPDTDTNSGTKPYTDTNTGTPSDTYTKIDTKTDKLPKFPMAGGSQTQGGGRGSGGNSLKGALGVWKMSGMKVYAPDPLSNRMAGGSFGKSTKNYGSVAPKPKSKKVGVVGSKLSGSNSHIPRMFKSSRV